MKNGQYIITCSASSTARLWHTSLYARFDTSFMYWKQSLFYLLARHTNFAIVSQQYINSGDISPICHQINDFTESRVAFRYFVTLKRFVLIIQSCFFPGLCSNNVLPLFFTIEFCAMKHPFNLIWSPKISDILSMPKDGLFSLFSLQRRRFLVYSWYRLIKNTPIDRIFL